MASERHTHKLTGCAPIPLAHYLKALGILRLVGEQADEHAQGWWSGDVFHLKTILNKAELLDFFRLRYTPTPLVVPWSGADFFVAERNPSQASFKSRYPIKSPRKLRPSGAQSIESLLATTSARFDEYRKIIREVFAVMASLSLVLRKD